MISYLKLNFINLNWLDWYANCRQSGSYEDTEISELVKRERKLNCVSYDKNMKENKNKK